MTVLPVCPCARVDRVSVYEIKRVTCVSVCPCARVDRVSVYEVKRVTCVSLRKVCVCSCEGVQLVSI